MKKKISEKNWPGPAGFFWRRVQVGVDTVDGPGQCVCPTRNLSYNPSDIQDTAAWRTEWRAFVGGTGTLAALGFQCEAGDDP